MDGEDREHEIDRWLDDAVAQYAKAEPRPGLEGRILARVAEARRESSQKLRWWGALALSAAAILVAALVWHAQTEPTQVPDSGVARVTAPTATKEHDASGQQLGSSAKQAASEKPPSTIAQSRLPRGVHAVVVENIAWPKLERFPTPQPLSDQEQMLARYVEEYSGKAALMARVQTEMHLQDESEMAAPWPNANPNISERPE